MLNIPLTQPILPTRDAYMRTLTPSWCSGTLSNFGELHNELEQKLSKRMGVPIMLYSSGTDALIGAIKALNLKGEIITTPFTFSATAGAILAAGCTPIYADIDKDTLCLDKSEVEKKITEKTSAILPVHIFGRACDVEGFEALGNKADLKLIYDCAHAFDISIDGKNVASFGDAAAFSFHATKLFHTIEGGALAINGDANAFESALLWRKFGTKAEEILSLGVNAKMSEAHAAMGICTLNMVELERSLRLERAEAYKNALADSGIKIHTAKNAQYLVIELSDEYLPIKDVQHKLKEKGVQSRRYFYPALSDVSCLEGKNDCPNASFAAAHCLALPFFGTLALSDVERNCKIIISCRR